MAKKISKRIRYANYVVSRKDLEDHLANDEVYQGWVSRAKEAKQGQREAELERDRLSDEAATALPEEREASRAERALAHARKRVKELIKERDRTRSVAHSARVDANRAMRRRVSANNISLRKWQADFRMALDHANERKTGAYQKLYAENYQEVLRKAGELGEEDTEGEEEMTDESLGLVPPPEEEEDHEQDG